MPLNRTYLTDIAGLIIYMILVWLSLNFFSISEYNQNPGKKNAALNAAIKSSGYYINTT